MSAMFQTRHYKAVAEVIRKHYQMHGSMNLAPYVQMNRQIEEMALDFAVMFKEDNPSFKPEYFLDACSPDPERYPFSELWEDYEANA